MRDVYVSTEAEAFNAAVNILAVEYLVKTDNKEEYAKRINQVYSLDEFELSVLWVGLTLNMHAKNLGEMITQGDYEEQREYLFEFLDEKFKEW